MPASVHSSGRGRLVCVAWRCGQSFQALQSATSSISEPMPTITRKA